MERTFALTAIPMVLREGDHTGHLEYVTFIATNGGYKKTWYSTNIGTYADDFAKIVPSDHATNILDRLSRGELVLFPGHFTLDEVLHQFGVSLNE